MTCKHDTSQGHHNISNSQSIICVDCKLPTGKDESFPSETIKNGGIIETMGETLMVEEFINDMVSETSHIDGPTVVEDNNKTTTVSKFGKAKPAVVHENNNSTMKLADTELKSNNTLGAHTVIEKEGLFYKWVDKYDVWNYYSYTSTKENKPGS